MRWTPTATFTTLSLGKLGWTEDPAALTRLGEREVMGWQVFVP